MSQTTTTVDVVAVNDSRIVMQVLSAGVPLSLLVDLVAPTPSAEILTREGGDAGWIRHVA